MSVYNPICDIGTAGSIRRLLQPYCASRLTQFLNASKKVKMKLTGIGTKIRPSFRPLVHRRKEIMRMGRVNLRIAFTWSSTLRLISPLQPNCQSLSGRSTGSALKDWAEESRIHGGSFDYGSASQPGLDGSSFAVKGNMVVVVLQYRYEPFNRVWSGWR